MASSLNAPEIDTPTLPAPSWLTSHPAEAHSLWQDGLDRLNQSQAFFDQADPEFQDFATSRLSADLAYLGALHRILHSSFSHDEFMLPWVAKTATSLVTLQR